MVYADEILDYSGQRKTGVTAGSYGPSADVSPEAGGTITVPQLTVNEKGLITGAVERTVTLPSGGGGGGGGEEQFQQVYTTTLAEEAERILIGSTDMGGAFVDVVAYIELPESDTSGTISVIAGADATMVEPPFLNLSLPYQDGAWFSFSVISRDGLMEITAICSDGIATPISGFLPLSNGGGSYPDNSKTGIALLGIAGDTSQGNLPAGTTITVYARKAVQ